MSRSIDIFVKAEGSLENLVDELESMLAIKLEVASDKGETWCEFSDGRIILTVGEHDFETDRDMDFENYTYNISVRGLSREAEERAKQPSAYARQVFQKLKATGKYPLMLTDDLQVKWEEYDPQLNVMLLTADN